MSLPTKEKVKKNLKVSWVDEEEAWVLGVFIMYIGGKQKAENFVMCGEVLDGPTRPRGLLAAS